MTRLPAWKQGTCAGRRLRRWRKSPYDWRRRPRQPPSVPRSRSRCRPPLRWSPRSNLLCLHRRLRLRLRPPQVQPSRSRGRWQCPRPRRLRATWRPRLPMPRPALAARPVRTTRRPMILTAIASPKVQKGKSGTAPWSLRPTVMQHPRRVAAKDGKGGQAQPWRFDDQMAMASTIVRLDVSPQAVKDKVFERLLADHGLGNGQYAAQNIPVNKSDLRSDQAAYGVRGGSQILGRQPKAAADLVGQGGANQSAASGPACAESMNQQSATPPSDSSALRDSASSTLRSQGGGQPPATRPDWQRGAPTTGMVTGVARPNPQSSRCRRAYRKELRKRRESRRGSRRSYQVPSR